MIQDDFTHTHALGSYLNVFILLDVLQCLLQREDGSGDDTSLLVGTAGADVGQLLGLSYVDYDVVVMHMLTYH